MSKNVQIGSMTYTNIDRVELKEAGTEDYIQFVLDGSLQPSTAGGTIFTGATVPLTYKDNTHDYENNYEYKSSTHNITITGLDGRATITGNGTKNVLVEFDVTSDTSSLAAFTISCEEDVETDPETIVYKGLHAHYGTAVAGILALACKNLPPEGDSGDIDVHYEFVVATNTDIPGNINASALWNGVYPQQVLNILIGNFSLTTLPNRTLRNFISFNQPLTIPEGVEDLSNGFLQGCMAFNQPLKLPSTLTTTNSYFLNIGSFNQPLVIPEGVIWLDEGFMNDAWNFNSQLTLPSTLQEVGWAFMWNCMSFNQPLTIPGSLVEIEPDFLSDCRAFNSPITIEEGITKIEENFLRNCHAFNQKLTLPESLVEIGNGFMDVCYSFNSDLIFQGNSLTTIGNAFLQKCQAFNKRLELPEGLETIGTLFLSECYGFNSRLTFKGTNLTTIGQDFLSGPHFNHPLELPEGLLSIGDRFLPWNMAFNSKLTLPNSLETIGNSFLVGSEAFNQHIVIPGALTSIGTGFFTNCRSLTVITWEPDVYPTDNNSLSTSADNKPNGIIVYGTNRAGLMTALPNRETWPFRLLIDFDA